MDTSARALVDHWKWAADKGLMNPNTAGALRATCAQVLGVLDNWEQVDIRQIDIDNLFRRFQNLRSKDFTPKSLDTYRSRFAKAVRSFLDYADNPSGWKGTTSQIRRQSKTSNAAAASGTVPPVPASSLPAVIADRQRTVTHPFLFRDGRQAMLALPLDLTLADVRRITAFLTTLAVDFDPDEQ